MPHDRFDPATEPPDALGAALLEALHRSADAASAAAVGRCHGTYRAREDRTVEALIDELATLRAMADAHRMRAEESAGAAPVPAFVGSGAAVEVAATASIGAFHNERTRQRDAARHALDHALRGQANAIRLAAFVQMQTGKDTATVVERHAAELAALLDRARSALSRSGRTMLRPEDMAFADPVKTCRQAVSDWNTTHAGTPCTFLAEASVAFRHDAGRIRETVSALVQACREHVGPAGRCEVGVAGAAAGLVVTVEGLVAEGATLAGAAAAFPCAPRWPLVMLLAEQTAAAHGGRFAVRRLPDRIACSLELRDAGGPPMPAAADG